MRVFFLDAAAGGKRFAVHYPAATASVLGKVLYLHPFAEEMNKSRRMAALQARALAQAGFEVLQLDLRGCGDSSDDFGDAAWQDWIDDALLACRWLEQQSTDAPLWLWGLRAGCLLATEAAARWASPAHLLLVQPPASGKPLLQQFLRLKLAADLMSGANKGLMNELRASLTRGEAVEIAGYTLSARLASGLEDATLAPPAQPIKVNWLELNSRSDAEWTPVSLQLQQRWREAGHTLAAELLQGPAFWQTSEIEEAPALVEATVRLMQASAQAQTGALV